MKKNNTSIITGIEIEIFIYSYNTLNTYIEINLMFWRFIGDILAVFMGLATQPNNNSSVQSTWICIVRVHIIFTGLPREYMTGML